MIIQFDTNTQEVLILNEDTKDWEKGYMTSMQYSICSDDLAGLDFSLKLPYGKNL